MHEPLYHLAVVVDDNLMGVTHVIRGEDHISNTPRQMLIAEAIGAQIPTYAHLPLILAPDRSKLSKRHGAISVTEYREMGYLPEAIVNFLALLGWSPQGGGSNNEVLFFDDLIERFDLSRVGKSGAIFNIEKLNWINREHLKRLPKENIIEKIENALPGKLRAFPEWSRDRLLKIIPLLIERIVKFSDITLMAESGELDYYFKLPTYDAQSLIWKKDPKGEAVLNDLPKLIDTIKLLPDSPFDRENIEKAILSFIGEKDKGSILWPMRYALTCKERSPDPFTIASVIGKPATLERLSIALEKIKNANI